MRVKENWLKCSTCGGRLVKNPKGGYVCESCGNQYDTIEKSEAEIPSQIVQQMNSADQERKLRHFDKALEIYNSVIDQAPNNLLALWGAFLSEYGIEYVKEGDNFVPRIHLITRIHATESMYIKKICQLCEDETKSARYRMMATEIEQLRHRTYEMSRNQEKFDVFICSGDNAYETQIADELFNELKKSGLKVFMPSRSIPYNTVSAEAYVFAASQSAETMFVVATDIATLEKTDYIWSRFIGGEGKKIQVIHSGLNESEFPYRLRKTFQRQAPISLNDLFWLNSAKDFVSKKKEKKDSTPKANVQTIINQNIILGDRKAESLSEAMLMVLSSINLNKVDVAKRIIQEQFQQFNCGELNLIAYLCAEVGALSNCPVADRNIYIDNIRNIGGQIRGVCPNMTQREREVYSDIEDSGLLIYLAKCFGVIKDRPRQCFILDKVNYRTGIYDARKITEFAQMLLTNGRMDEVGEVMRGAQTLEGNTLLLSYLKNYSGNNVQKQINLRAAADNLKITPTIADDLNMYLSSCDDEGTALAVVDIMNRRDVPLDALGIEGVLSEVKDVDSVKVILDNFSNRQLLSVEIDRLVTIAANGGNDVANEVLNFLHNTAKITDLGSYNMKLLLEKCDLEKIKITFFDFNIDKKLATQLLIGAIEGNSADRLSTVRELVGRINSIDIKNYEKLLLGGDPLKVELMRFLAPKTGKYSAANKQIESFLSGRDDDEDKREIFAMFGDFPFSKRSLELYLDILPESFDETYVRYLYQYLDENPIEARKYFVRHYEALVEGYEKHLEKIFNYVRSFDEVGICRFMTEFKGAQEVKDSLVQSVVDFAEKPKKIDVMYKNVQCNLLQAYLLTISKYTNMTGSVIQYLRKKGMDADDKIVVGSKKMKFKDYLQSGEVSQSTVDIINMYIKL